MVRGQGRREAQSGSDSVGVGGAARRPVSRRETARGREWADLVGVSAQSVPEDFFLKNSAEEKKNPRK